MLKLARSLILIVTFCWKSGIDAFSPFSQQFASTSNNGIISRTDDEITSRRNILTSSLAAAFGAGVFSLVSFPATATAAPTLEKYEDTQCKFSINLPSEWTKSIQTLPDRRTITLYFKPDSDQKTLIFLAKTPVRDDFTSLGSFGSVDEVAQSTILPKGELAGVEGVKAQMLSAVAKKQAYFFDYVQTVPSQPETHFRTIFALANNANVGGAGNVLVTITAQAPQADYGTVQSLFDEIINSYQ
jgi:hypothetical protein